MSLTELKEFRETSIEISERSQSVFMKMLFLTFFISLKKTNNIQC